MSHKSTKPLELVHSDVWGPSPIVSALGYKYYVLFLDDYTKYCWLYPLTYKSDVLATFKVFKAKLENLLNSRIKILRSDSGGEYCFSSWHVLFNETYFPFATQAPPISSSPISASSVPISLTFSFPISPTSPSSSQSPFPLDRRSTSGWCVFLGSNLISWSAKKQPTVSRSSTESEYRGIAMTAAELVYIAKLFKDIGFQLPSAPLLWCDNQSALHLAYNPVFSARTKHVEVDYHFIRELVQHGILHLRFVDTTNQLTDIFTKSLPSARHAYLVPSLQCAIPTSACEGLKRVVS
ncbi:hypothetical protein L3X38_012416 [Prunus dulcis]|uniref:Integrase catalytic domain-containing protein n=1 Tax=Prunus dulcis TaxID=3755 RepID=A0AAD4WKW5_PRUDU|nr:hypothetical protein L3X38_012416 [Prunus dulcis]